MSSIPSIAMIPAGYGTSKVYSQLPVDGTGDFTYSRTGVATRVNSDGLIEEVDANVPQLDYSDGGCPALLLEPQRTNLLTYSEQFDNAGWTKTNVTVTPNSITAPDGTVTGDLIDISSSGTDLRQAVTVTASTDYTFSFYIRRGTSTNMEYRVFDVSNASNIIAPTSYYSQTSDSDWTRITVSFTTPTGCTSVLVWVNSENSGIGTFYTWGAQVEQGSYATSYIKTEGSTVPRGGATAIGAGDSSSINSTEGVLIAEISANTDNTGISGLSLSDNTTSNRVSHYFSNTSNNIQGDVVVGGVVQASYNVNLIDVTLFSKIALKYSANSFSAFVNGVQIMSDNVGSVFTAGVLNDLSEDLGGGSFPFYGKVKYLAVEDTALTDLELEAQTGFGSWTEMATQLKYTQE